MDKKLKRDFPTTKDFVYWIIILVIFITVIIVWRTADPETLLNEISLGSTFLSIFLAVIAIIFAIIQSSDSSRQNRDIYKEVNKVTQQVIELNGMKNQIAESIDKSQESVDKSQTIFHQYVKRIEELSELKDDTEKSKKFDAITEEVKNAIQSIKNDNHMVNQHVFEVAVRDSSYDIRELISSIDLMPNVIKVFPKYEVVSESPRRTKYQIEVTIRSVGGIGNEDLLQHLWSHMDKSKVKLESIWTIL